MVVGCGGCVWVLGVSSLYLTAHYSCPSISGAYWKFQGYPEVLGVVLEFGS